MGVGRDAARPGGGYARSIGVSNFSASRARRAARDRRRDPVVNQVQFSPFEFRRGLWEAAEERRSRSRPTARSAPAATSATRAWRAIAERLGHTPAQVLIRWALERNLIVLPKSTHRERIEANAQVFDFTLSEEDVAALDALDHTGGTAAARESIWW